MAEQNRIPIAVLLSLALPVCSGLGFFYASGYFQEIGCKWAISLLSIQQLIIYSSVVSIAFVVPFMAVAGLLFSGFSYAKILAYHSAIVVLAILGLYAGKLAGKIDASFFELIMFTGVLTIASSYISETIVAINSNAKKEYINFSLASSLSAALLTASMSTSIGQSYAAYQLNNKDRFFPSINDSTYGVEQRLISAVGPNFLIANLKENKIKSFRVVSNIQSYTISKSNN